MSTNLSPVAVVSDGPHPDHVDELALFGRFVGAWDMRSVRFDRDRGELGETALEWVFFWALDGRAIIDVLRGEGGIGTTVRIPHPEHGTWSVSWQSTRSPELFAMTARADGERILLTGTSSDGLEEWTFNDITDDTFRWQSRVSDDGGATWFVDQVMHATRRR